MINCMFDNCINTKIVARFLCAKHFDYEKYRGNLDKYPRMKRKDGTGSIYGGYKTITIDGKQVLEHRYIMEKLLGRKLKRAEVVHHIDHNGLNNAPRNLIITSQKEHMITFHNNKPRIFDWNLFDPKKSNRICPVCHQQASKKTGLCKKHYNAYWQWRERH